MLNAHWHWLVIILTIGSILACWWLLHWTKGDSAQDAKDAHDTGHVWDHDIRELNNPLPRWWLHLFNITIVFALLYLVLYPGLGNVSGVLGWTQLNRYEAEVEAATSAQAETFARYAAMDATALAADPAAMETARRLFGNHCAMCHGSDARGGPGFPNLRDAEWQWGAGNDNILEALASGRQGVMPPWGAALGEDGVREVVEYVQQLSGQSADAALASAGAPKFGMFCAACHGPDGTGNVALGAPDLSNDIWLYGGSREAIAETIVNGRNGVMPVFAQTLGEEHRKLLAAYVGSLDAR